ncbi:DUF397 domain-containing protein [Streptomyces sp. NPDC004542]|uniref:DUF397 domain-containing protein n=1 Tax=Streptomyces sp. NPDC004542 TaxID=3154281 RepID=UPI0033B1EE58
MTSPVHWQKSSYSGGGDGNNCLELAALHDSLLVRESEEPATALKTSRPPIAALIGHLRDK